MLNLSDRRLRQFTPLVLLMVLLVGSELLSGCDRRSRTADKIAEDTQQIDDFDNSLTFNDVTLEEFDKQGRLWWRVKAKQASYSKDRQIARVMEPIGELYQDGKLFLKVKAKSGEVQKNGEKLNLQGDILAEEPKDGLVLRANWMEWQPKANLLIVREKVSGTHPKAKMTAKEGKFFTKDRRLEMGGQVFAEATDPNVQFRSDKLVWLMQEQIFSSDRPIQIDRLQNKVLTDRATANAGTMNMKTRIATLTQNAQLNVSDPPIQATSNSIVWNFKTKKAVSDQPITILNKQQGVTLIGDRGEMDLNTRMFYLTGNVRGIGEKNQSNVSSDRLTWNMTTQAFLAEGNVVYDQTNPVFHLTGPRASGTMKDRNIIVSGGRVETQFIPEQVGKLVGN